MGARNREQRNDGSYAGAPGHPWAAIFGLTPIALVRSGQAEDAADTRPLAGWEEAHGSRAHRERLHARLQRDREE